MKRFALSTALLFGLAACGGGEPAADAPAEGAESAPAAQQPAAAPGEMTMPEWFQMDGTAVTLDIVAGATNKGNYWNYNGAQFGEMTITVPVGAEVTINFSNQDPNMAHSIGISPGFDSAPAMVDPAPVFAGAISSNPTSLTEATMPGEAETITFTASEAGEYSMVCYIAGHAVSGMWVHFVVSADGEAGVTGNPM
ncbi:MAG TPA: sulfocyanin-like copper-binding protein [Longimicrobiales bacterium]|nr:sulfocyanin-like copper-binding protein [Longimicrobiales bacterium]